MATTVSNSAAAANKTPATSAQGSLASALFNRKKAKSKKKHTPPPSRPNGVAVSPPPAEPLSSADENQVDDLADQLLTQLDERDKTAEQDENDKGATRLVERAPSTITETGSVAPSSSSVSNSAVSVSASSNKSSSSMSSFKNGMKDLFSPSRAKSRQQARKDRREKEFVDMQLAARRELQENKDTDWAEEEHQEMLRICKSLHAELREISPDGHCLYAALADQMNSHRFNRELETYQTVRTGVAQHMRQNPDEFLPFLVSETEGSDGIMAPEEYAAYCDKIEKTSEWGGQPEIIAASKAFKVPIHIYQAHTKTVKIGDEQFTKALPLRLSYHRHMYGLGEHYNSLRQKIVDMSHSAYFAFG